VRDRYATRPPTRKQSLLLNGNVEVSETAARARSSVEVLSLRCSRRGGRCGMTPPPPGTSGSLRSGSPICPHPSASAAVIALAVPGRPPPLPSPIYPLPLASPSRDRPRSTHLPTPPIQVTTLKRLPSLHPLQLLIQLPERLAPLPLPNFPPLGP